MRTTGRKSQEVYPEPGLNVAGASNTALRNRNIAVLTALNVPFTPNNDFIAAILFTPRVSGVLQIAAELLVQNGSDAETYFMGMELVPYTNPTVTGGDTTVDGWVMGTTSLPVVGGTPGSTTLALEAFTPSLIAGAPGSMQVFGISDQVTPLPIGVPVVIAVLLGEIGGGHALAQLAVANLSVMELP